MNPREALAAVTAENPAWADGFTDRQTEALCAYWELVERWGGALNLSRRRSPLEWARADVADAFLGLRAAQEVLASATAGSGGWMDIGSGAGFPGVALALSFPGISMRWVETLQRRVSFLMRVRKALDLAGVEVCALRVERVTVPAQVVTVRATFPWRELHRARHCVAPGGMLLAFVGREPGPAGWAQEVAGWGWKSRFFPYAVEGLGSRAVAVALRPAPGVQLPGV